MFATTRTLRRLSLGALLAVLVLAGLAAAPADAQNRTQNRCAVSPQRAQQLVWRYRKYGAKKVQIARRYHAIKAWCERNWRISHTPRYKAYRAEMKNLKVQYNWARHHMNMIQAEYHGRSHGWVAGGGSTTNRRPAAGGLLNVRPTRATRATRPTTRTTSRTTRTTRTGTTTSRGPSFSGLNLLNQRVRNNGNRR